MEWCIGCSLSNRVILASQHVIFTFRVAVSLLRGWGTYACFLPIATKPPTITSFFNRSLLCFLSVGKTVEP